MQNKEVLQALNNVTEHGREMGGEDGERDYKIVLNYIEALEGKEEGKNNKFDYLPDYIL